MKNITDEDIKRAIRNCHWRHKVPQTRDLHFCHGDVNLCEHLIETGRCDTLQRLFQQAQKEEEKKDD